MNKGSEQQIASAVYNSSVGCAHDVLTTVALYFEGLRDEALEQVKLLEQSPIPPPDLGNNPESQRLLAVTYGNLAEQLLAMGTTLDRLEFRQWDPGERASLTDPEIDALIKEVRGI